ncbi:MAG: hypothetical protein L3J47_01675 [Sulfurovum sp.]|nr:hypothetical protein [Sulfurovum sp.]
MDPIEELQDYSLMPIQTKEHSHNNRVIVNDRYFEKRVSIYAFIEQKPYHTSFISLIFFPYIIGMVLLLLLFSLYWHIPVRDFFQVYNGFSQILFWVFGIYFVITALDIWWLVKKLFGKW